MNKKSLLLIQFLSLELIVIGTVHRPRPDLSMNFDVMVQSCAEHFSRNAVCAVGTQGVEA